MELSTAQMRAIENGEAVPITVGHTKCVLIREDLYERMKAMLDIEDTYPLLDETFREGWDAPGMADYDRYDELKHRRMCVVAMSYWSGIRSRRVV